MIRTEQVKTIKGATILARSSDGNVRVRDVVRAYALQGRDGISELAWTSPITEYLDRSLRCLLIRTISMLHPGCIERL